MMRSISLLDGQLARVDACPPAAICATASALSMSRDGPSPSITRDASSASTGQDLSFDAVYDQYAEFVWRVLRRLGVPASSVDDAAQDVFFIAHRRLGEFGGRSSLKTWLFGVVANVARRHLRSARRKSPENPDGEPIDPDTLAHETADPLERAEKAEAVRLLYALLDELDDAKRAIFVLAELEQMSMPEIAEALAINVNTAYARLRAARQSFEKAVERHRARADRRNR
jgi:RNA polymerase sigma-70 factor, ECF subfamily